MIVVLLVFLGVAVFVFVSVVQGIIQYIKAPKPPKGLTYDELRSYYQKREWEMDEPLTLNDRIARCLTSGKKIEAIKIVRDECGVGLSEAKKIVERVEYDLKYQRTSCGAEGVYSSHMPNENEGDIFGIDGMEGHEFEQFCANILRKNGFTKVSVTKGSGDQGVDILAEKGGVKYAIQCKNYTSPLSNTPVQEVNAGKMFYNCHVGVVMTNSTFTAGARALAEATGVLLWDRAILIEMIESPEKV